MIAHVHPQGLQDWFTQTAPGQVPLVLDVREPWELQTASIVAQGFELLAIPMGSVPQQLAALAPARPVACLCHHGARSLRVAAFLENHGFEHVANITGGIDAWSLERDCTVPRY